MNILEVCAASLFSAKEAAEGGAQRIELCTRLDLDGLTPPMDEIRQASEINGLTVNVLIRCREGGFVYSRQELNTMESQIREAVRLGADGIVIGALTPDGDIDTAGCRQLMEAAQGLPVTFHRAFDQCRDPRKGLEDIIEMGCSRLLTSGQAGTAEAGIGLLRELNEQARGRIIIMPGAGVNPVNAARILQETGCREIHSSARRQGESDTNRDVVGQIIKEINGIR